MNMKALPTSSMQGVIDFMHQAVHEDIVVSATDVVPDLDIATPRRYLIKRLAGFDLHSVVILTFSSGLLLKLYEAPTLTGNGTRCLHMRHNRKSPILDTARDTTFFAPTYSAIGTLIWQKYTGGTNTPGAQRIGGESRKDQEVILHPDRDYIVEVTALADNTLLSMEHTYYEVTQ